MGRRARATMTGANGVAVTTTGAPAMRLDQQGAEASPAALVTFAEEFGTLLARQLLAGPNRRRGYSLPEELVGLAFNAVMLLLAYCLMAWLRR